VGLDNHVNEGGVQGQLSNLLKELGQELSAFHQDMATAWKYCGCNHERIWPHRQGKRNRGTDHGHANCMFVMGGDVKAVKFMESGPASPISNSTRAAILC